MAVNLTRIYTRTGDAGETRLGDNSSTSKTDPRLAAYGEVDEANSAIGVAIAAGHLNSTIVVLLTRIQNDLFDVGADLCNPIAPDPEYPPLPPHIKLSQAQHMAKALLRGDPGTGQILKESMKGKLHEFVNR